MLQFITHNFQYISILAVLYMMFVFNWDCLCKDYYTGVSGNKRYKAKARAARVKEKMWHMIIKSNGEIIKEIFPD